MEKPEKPVMGEITSNPGTVTQCKKMAGKCRGELTMMILCTGGFVARVRV